MDLFTEVSVVIVAMRHIQLSYQNYPDHNNSTSKIIVNKFSLQHYVHLSAQLEARFLASRKESLLVSSRASCFKSVPQ